MPHRRRRTLTIAPPSIGPLAATSIAILLAFGASVQAAGLEYLGTHIWREQDIHFGGFSAIELGADGNEFHALTDRAHLFWGRIQRDEDSRIIGMEIKGRSNLKDGNGQPLPRGIRGDSEGMAIGPDGMIWVSFEGQHRVAGYADPHAPALQLPRPPRLPELSVNEGFESLAILPDGSLMTMPESSPSPEAPFPVLHFRDGEWIQPYTIRRDGNWLAVGSDYGPDDWFYLLERDFHGIMGFSSRIRRMRLTDDGPADEQILLETMPLQFDNLEGISVWHDGQHVRMTLISDDNFLFLQRTELVEFRVIEQ